MSYVIAHRFTPGFGNLCVHKVGMDTSTRCNRPRGEHQFWDLAQSDPVVPKELEDDLNEARAVQALLKLSLKQREAAFSFFCPTCYRFETSECKCPK